jgi:hypothetical protein
MVGRIAASGELLGALTALTIVQDGFDLRCREPVKRDESL